MTIGLDYDQTFSEDPKTWHGAMSMMKCAGHKIIGVTLRSRDMLIEDPLYFDVCEKVVYCAGLAKRKLLDELGIPIDVWIDDTPDYILNSWVDVNGSSFTGWPTDDPRMQPLVVET